MGCCSGTGAAETRASGMATSSKTFQAAEELAKHADFLASKASDVTPMLHELSKGCKQHTLPNYSGQPLSVVTIEQLNLHHHRLLGEKRMLEQYHQLAGLTRFGILIMAGTKHGLAAWAGHKTCLSEVVGVPESRLWVYVDGQIRTDIYALIGSMHRMPDLHIDEATKLRHFLEKVAHEGNEKAMYALGAMESDHAKRCHWYRMAADKGHVASMIALGRDCETDLVKKRDWYAKAAALGSACAMFNLAVTEKDPQKQRDWYRQASDKGDVDAMFNLGASELDPQVQRDWYLKAAHSGHSGAKYNLESPREHHLTATEKLEDQEAPLRSAGAIRSEGISPS